MSSEFLATNAVKRLQQQKGLSNSLKQLMQDEERNERMYREFDGVCLDFSRQLIDKEGLDALMELAKERQVMEKVQRMFRGEEINETEKRRVLHVALRMPKENKNENQIVDKNIIQEVHQAIRLWGLHPKGTLKGATGERLTNLICVGIGGSYLGSEFLVESLKTEEKAKEKAAGRTIRSAHVRRKHQFGTDGKIRNFRRSSIRILGLGGRPFLCDFGSGGSSIGSSLRL
ncbi:glucose-6-phosphate isomerase, putative [Eimeria brunetti]|uniref:Glucose-6-phosphate isomerase, putative n=1 Tax=Eimeria brunetti TaxID=51314 RepID=U6LZW0_9EIME|nr:glucose-6-phosphate isomerase, putative [Eimeria brunetti]